MRHRKKGRQLGRNTSHRRALFRSLVTSLLEHERIETTEAKAKEIRGFTDRMITLGKRGDLPARRRALGFLLSKTTVSKLFSEVAARFRDRPGGYTRIIKTRRRVGDAAELVAPASEKDRLCDVSRARWANAGSLARTARSTPVGVAVDRSRPPAPEARVALMSTHEPDPGSRMWTGRLNTWVVLVPSGLMKVLVMADRFEVTSTLRPATKPVLDAGAGMGCVTGLGGPRVTDGAAAVGGSTGDAGPFPVGVAGVADADPEVPCGICGA